MPGNVISLYGSAPFVSPVTLTGVAAVTMSSYAATGMVNGVSNIVTITTSGAHGLGAMLSAASNIAQSSGTNTGKNWGQYNWTIGAPGAATSLPNPGGINSAPLFPWLGVTMSADATVGITGGSYLVVAVPSSTTFQIVTTSAQFAKWTGTLAGTPSVTPFLVPGPGSYLVQLGANCTLLSGVTTNAAGVALPTDIYIPGSVNGVVTGAAVGGVTPGSVIPFFNSGVPIGGTVAAVVHATGNATTVCVPFNTDGTIWQINPLGAGTSRLYKYL